MARPNQGSAIVLLACLWLVIGLCACLQSELQGPPGRPPYPGPQFPGRPGFTSPPPNVSGPPGQPLNVGLGLMHPTFFRARLLDDGRTVLETDDMTFVRSENLVGKYNGVNEIDKDVSSTTNLYKATNDETRQKSGRIDYKYEIGHLRKYKDTFGSGIGRGSSCNKQVFRAFDLTKIFKPRPSDPAYIGVGVSDNHLCIVNYTSKDVESFFSNPLDDISSAYEFPLHLTQGHTFYKIQSVTIQDIEPSVGQPHLLIDYYDEAGSYQGIIVDRTKMVLIAIRQPITISSFNLHNLRSSMFNPDQVEELTREQPHPESLKTSATGWAILSTHFRHSFIEAISILDGTLAFSRGLFLPSGRLNLVGGNNSTWPPALLEPNLKMSIQALEAYKYEGFFYYHVFDIRVAKNDIISPQVNYWWCRFNRTEDAVKVDWPTFSNEHLCRNYKDDFELAKTPIDVIYRPQCKKVYAFYQHMFQTENADKYFTGSSKITVVDWMRFPVSAMLHYNNRLYLFGAANRLFITNPLSGCEFDQVTIASEHYSSELILLFSDKYKYYDYGKLTPYFDNTRIYDENVWKPPFGTRSKREIDAKDLLRPEIPDIAMPPETGPPDSDSGSGKSPGRPTSSMIIITLVAIIVVGVVCGCIYYFLVARAIRALPRRQKSTMRARKEVSSPTGSLTRGKQPGSSTGTSGAQKSTLSPILTVRSHDLHQSRTSSGITKSPSTKSALMKSTVKSRMSKRTGGSKMSPGAKSVGISLKTDRKSIRSPGVRRASP